MPERRNRLPHGRQRTRPKPWYEKGTGPARLTHDKSLVTKVYPTLQHQTHEGDLDLEGVFVYESKSGIRDQVKTRVDFPALYPDQEPRAYDVANRFEHTLDRHFYKDSYREGRCCMWLPPNSKWNPRDSDALITFLDELLMFFERQLICDATGKWPGPQYAHGHGGYEEWVTEELGGDKRVLTTLKPLLTSSMKISRNDLCPCESQKKYKKCHLHSIEHIQRGVDRDILRQLFSS